MYIGMWLWIRDPPAPEDHHANICEGARVHDGKLWTAMKSFAVFMPLIQCYGTQAISNLMSPANNGIASISKPTNIQTGIGSVLGNLSLMTGVWVFRQFFLATSWRVTLFMSVFFFSRFNFSTIDYVYLRHVGHFQEWLVLHVYIESTSVRSGGRTDCEQPCHHRKFAKRA